MLASATAATLIGLGCFHDTRKPQSVLAFISDDSHSTGDEKPSQISITLL